MLLGRRQGHQPVTVKRSWQLVHTYGIDGTSTKSERNYYPETNLMTFGGLICGIQLANIGLCLRADTLHIICNLVSLGAVKRARCVRQCGAHPCIAMLLAPYQRFFRKGPRERLVIGYFAFANECAKKVTGHYYRGGGDGGGFLYKHNLLHVLWVANHL